MSARFDQGNLRIPHTSEDVVEHKVATTLGQEVKHLCIAHGLLLIVDLSCFPHQRQS